MQEETGLTVEPLRLVDVFFRPPGADYGPHSTVSVVYLCAVRGGAVAVASHEVRQACYREITDVDVWHRDHARYATAAHSVWQTMRGGAV